MDDPRPRAAIEAERVLSAAILASREKKSAPVEERPNSRTARIAQRQRTTQSTQSSQSPQSSQSSLPPGEDNNSSSVLGAYEGDPTTEEAKTEETKQEGDSKEEEGEEGEGLQFEADEGSIHMNGQSALLGEEEDDYTKFPKAPLPGRTNIMQYTSSSNAGNVLGLPEEVRNAQGMGGFWRDQNPGKHFYIFVCVLMLNVY